MTNKYEALMIFSVAGGEEAAPAETAEESAE